MTEVELTLVPDDDLRVFLPFVTVEINGVRVEALLDSGASRSQLVNQAGVVTKNGFTPASAGVFGGQTAATSSATVSFRVGGLDAGTVEVTVVPTGLPGHGNLIGQDVLGQFRCLYRLANGLLVLNAEPPKETHSIYLDVRRHIYLDLTWDDPDVEASAVFDTGASVTVVDEHFAELHPELFTSEGTSTGMDTTGQSIETPMAIMRGPLALDEQFTDVLVAIVDLSGANSTLERPMDLILGWTMLSQADWYIDQQSARGACLPRG